MKERHELSYLQEDPPTGDLYLDAGPQLSHHVRLLEEAQAAQVLLELSLQLRLAGPQLPVSGAAVGAAVGARGRGLPMETAHPQFGELSGDGLLGDVVLPGQAWNHKGHRG